MKIQKDSKSIDIGKVKKVNEFGKVIGLMFSRREKADSLLFEFKKPTKMKIHSCFVFFDFLAIWLDNKGKIISSEIVKPFRLGVGIKEPFYKLLEIPINKKNKRVIEISRR
ncbi:MAG: DUF192 domain-containing protein [Nanoarchaeota archaeon]|nr:DUF192 domain-containing protein [Nanoarchaeota archaeon]